MNLMAVNFFGCITFGPWVFFKCSNITSLIYCRETVADTKSDPDIFGGEPQNGYSHSDT